LTSDCADSSFLTNKLGAPVIAAFIPENATLLFSKFTPVTTAFIPENATLLFSNLNGN